MTTPAEPWVIVVGAGPSGLLLGLLLAQRGIPVHLIDQSDKLDEQPRATHYATPAMWELRRAGVTDDLRAAGFMPNTVCWRKLDGTYLTGLDTSVLGDDPDRMVCLPLNQLGRILYDHLKRHPSATVSWGQKVVSLGQDDSSAWIDVETPQGRKTLRAKYIVGCDGANSQVRRSLFGDTSFPGKTWDEQIVATNVSFPLPLNQKLHAQTSHRHTTTLKNSAGMIPISSSTLNTGTWLPRSQRTDYTE